MQNDIEMAPPAEARRKTDGSDETTYAPQALGITDAERNEVAIARSNPNTLVEWGVPESKKMGDFEVICLILNRCIGTGVFMSASIITRNTQSIGLAIIFWMCGGLVAIAGTYMFVELGLTIPQHKFNGNKVSTPRNGGELNYLTHMMGHPKFFALCVFGIMFMILGNTAANSISFGQNVLLASGRDTADWGSTLAIGVSATTFACLLHGISRTWGIRLNTAFGVTKVTILLFLTIVGFIAAGKNSGRDATPLRNDLEPGAAFQHTERSNKVFRYAEAFLFVLFPFGGFHQANYVLAEIDSPRKRFKRSAFLAVAIICVMFTLLNVAFTWVVPKADQFAGGDVGTRFFQIASDTLWSTSPKKAQRVFAAFKSITSIGNIIVVTFTASRVKQEIAKEGIFPPVPSHMFWAKSYYFSLTGIFRGQKIQQNFSTESTPVPALFLHWLFTTILVVFVLAGVRNDGQPATDAYFFVVGVYTYSLVVFVYTWVSLGLLHLRLSPGSDWYKISRANHYLSIFAALIMLCGTIFPLVCMWIPDSAKSKIGNSDVDWFVPQTVSVGILAVAISYWLIFRYVVSRVHDHKGKEFVSKRKIIFSRELDEKTKKVYLIQMIEIVNNDWSSTQHAIVDEEMKVIAAGGIEPRISDEARQAVQQAQDMDYEIR